LKIVDVVLSPSEMLPEGGTWLVVDILRATSNIVNFFDLGGKEIVLASTIEKARQVSKGPCRDWLLAGERNMLPPHDFDMGNSPLEYDKKLIENYPGMILATTNGTSALIAASTKGETVLAACSRNSSAAAKRSLQGKGPVVILCSGRNGRAALDDILCAGLLVERILKLSAKPVKIRDGARIALELWKNCGGNLYEGIKKSDHARLLEDAGMVEDILFCCEIDKTKKVPRLVSKGDLSVLRVDSN
jgi:2-phosphosulfolactate phosphatase